MHAATYDAFFDELQSIQMMEKDALDLRSALRAGTEVVKKVGDKADRVALTTQSHIYNASEDLLDAARKKAGKIIPGKLGKAVSKAIPRTHDLIEKAPSLVRPGWDPNTSS